MSSTVSWDFLLSSVLRKELTSRSALSCSPEISEASTRRRGVTKRAVRWCPPTAWAPAAITRIVAEF